MLLAVSAFLFTWTAAGANIVPDFANAPAGWSTDRYAPASFSNVGSYQGLSNVIGIGIDNATGGVGGRPNAYQSSFYNTQGDQTPVSGGVGDIASALLYVPSSWSDPSNGNVRTDEWLQTDDASGAPSYYAILGFTNYGGAARFRGWDSNGSWVDFSGTVNYDSWNLLTIAYGAGSISYSVNGALAGTMTDAPANDRIAAYFLQAYNFNANLPSVVLQDYTANWANASAIGGVSVLGTPEPATWITMACAAAVLVLLKRKRRDETKD